MKKRISIHDTLVALRNLPLEVSIGQVRQWVRSQSPPAGRQKQQWFHWFREYFFSNN